MAVSRELLRYRICANNLSCLTNKLALYNLRNRQFYWACTFASQELQLRKLTENVYSVPSIFLVAHPIRVKHTVENAHEWKIQEFLVAIVNNNL